MTDTELVKPCPFCSLPMVEAGAFRTHSTRTFLHDADGLDSLLCPASNTRIIISDDPTSRKRLDVWNNASRPPAEPQRVQDMEPIGYRWRLPDGGMAAAFAPEVIAEMRLQNGEPSQRLYDESQMERVILAQIDRRELVEGLMLELGDAWDCTRTWDAWSVGTMTADDFEPVAERVEEIADGIIERMRP